MNLITRLLREDRGQGLVEYGLIIGLISLVAIAMLTSMGGSLTGMFDSISGKLTGAENTVTSGAS